MPPLRRIKRENDPLVGPAALAMVYIYGPQRKLGPRYTSYQVKALLGDFPRN